MAIRNSEILISCCREVDWSYDRSTGVCAYGNQCYGIDGYQDYAFQKKMIERVLGKRILIELKTWEKSIPASILGMTAERLKSARIKEEADKAILVTPSKLKIPKSFQPEEEIEIMTKKELRNYFAHAT